MHSRFAALCAAAVMTVGVAVVFGPPAAGASPQPAVTARSAGRAPGSVRDVTLPTGDQLQVVTAADGRESVAARPSTSGRGWAYSLRQIDGDTYVIPAAASPFVGHGLDMSLFDVDRLPSGTAHIPVRFGGAPPPGVTRTAAGVGYLTQTSAATFGAALARQVGRAAAAGSGAPALPAGTTAVSAPVPAARPTTVVGPDYDMWTAKVRVLDATGTPAQFASVWLVNTDDSSRYSDSPVLDNGTGRASVPTGHYSAIADVTMMDDAGQPTAVREVSIADITITKNITITLDSRKSVPVAAITPHPAITENITLAWVRAAADGNGGHGSETLVSGGVSAFEAPTSAAVVGSLTFGAFLDLSSPATSSSNYTYNLAFPATGAVPASQTYHVTAATLSTMHTRYFTDVAGRIAESARTPTLSNGLIGVTSIQAFALPRTQTEFVTADPAVQWVQSVAPTIGTTPTMDVPRTYLPGSSEPVDWFRGPLVPGFGADAGAASSFRCPACRTPAGMYLAVAPTVDSTPGHTEAVHLFGKTHTVAVTHLVLTSGTTVLMDDRSGLPDTVAVPAGDTNFTLSIDETRQASWVRESTASHTEWTFVAPAPSTTALPPAWYCQVIAGACGVLPLLTVNYQLGSGTDGTAPPGPDTADIAIAHLPGAATIPITTASVKVSFDDGTTWTPTSVTDRGAGHYRARWTNPASVTGGGVALEVTARDAAGDTVTQTTHNAYAIDAGGAQ